MTKTRYNLKICCKRLETEDEKGPSGWSRYPEKVDIA